MNLSTVNFLPISFATKGRIEMIEIIDKHWIIFNPISALIFAHIALMIVFSMLGWSE